jgi:hypothetical protein
LKSRLAEGTSAYFEDIPFDRSLSTVRNLRACRARFGELPVRSGRTRQKDVAAGATPELARYIQIAMGSASELQNHLRLAKDLGFSKMHNTAQLFKELTSVRQMLTAFLQRLRATA